MKDRFQTQESWWKQKFKELEAFCKGQSTPTTPFKLDVQATEPEPDVQAQEPEA